MKLVKTACLVVAALWLGASLEAAAQPGSVPAAGPAAAGALRLRGLELGYNLDHAEAIAAFKEAIAADPENPAAYRLLAASTWITMLFQQGAITVDDFLGQARASLRRSPPDAALDATFHDALRRAMTLAEQQLRERPSDAAVRYQVGAAYGYQASYTATVEGRVLGSFGSARRAFREHERVLELDPSRKDAGLIVGLYRYSVAALPAPLRLMARIVGLGGDRERGLRLVEEAARYPSDVQANALLTLIVIYNREERYDDALRVIGDLQQRYPRNRLLWLEAGGTALRAKRFTEARAALEEGLVRLSRDSRPRALGEEARWRYTYGATLVALKDAAAAEPQLRAALAAAAHDWVRGRAHRELGKLADLSGDRPRAREEYRLAERLCRRDHDSECSDEVKRLLK